MRVIMHRCVRTPLLVAVTALLLLPAYPSMTGATVVTSGVTHYAARTSQHTRMSVSGSACTTWNLAADFQVAPSQANPNPDSCGTPGVWSFMQSATLVHDVSTYTTNTLSRK